MLTVRLVCMPFQIASISSLSTTLLATVLRQQGVDVRELYPHLEFARLIGADRYRQVTDGDTTRGLLGELFFAEGIHGRSSNAALAELFGDDADRDRLRRQFLEYLIAQFEPTPPGLVGMTTSFNQLMPSLWLTREMKERWPGVRTVLGGSACTGDMGMAVAAAYPFVDCVVSGNGERPLLALATETLDLPENRVIVDEQPVDLNQLPMPDYDAFVETATRYGRAGTNLMLAYETSRGCWWGEKHHCTFCGINGAQMRFAAKTPERA